MQRYAAPRAALSFGMRDGHSPECGLGRNAAPRTWETDALTGDKHKIHLAARVQPNESRISCVVRRPPSRWMCSLSSGRHATTASCAC